VKAYLKNPAWQGLLVFLLFAAAYILPTTPVGRVFEPRWDAVHYLSIATRGYELNPCGPELERRGVTICGNIWFPGWPYFNELVGAFVPVHLETVFRITATALMLACILLAVQLAPILRPAGSAAARNSSSLIPIVLVAMPGSFYLLTAYPYVFELALGIVYCLIFYTARRYSWRWQIVLVGLAIAVGMAYPTGCLLAVLPCGSLLLERDTPVLRRVLACAWYILPFGLGIALVCLILYGRFGDFWLYFRHQAQPNFGRGGGNPVTTLWEIFHSPQISEALTLGWYVAGLGIFVRRPLRVRPEALAFVALTMLVPLATGNATGIYRQCLLAFPFLFWIAESERPLWLTSAYLLSGILINAGRLFPMYVRGHLM
jgi:hypothetical protein